jgi:hypothetical protein
MVRSGLVGIATSFVLGGCMATLPESPRPAPAAAEPAAAPVVASAPAPQTDKYGPGTGESIVSLATQLSSTRVAGSTVSDVILSGGGGYFLTDEHEVGGQLLVAYIKPSGTGSATLESILPYYNYNYRQNSRLWYYGGPHMGLQHVAGGGESSNSFAIGMHAGGRYWLSPSTAVYAEPRYTYSRQLGHSANEITLLLGLSVTF